MCQKWFQRFLKLKDKNREGERKATPSSYSGSCNEMKKHNSNKLTNKKQKGVDVYG